jgi:hypothetical protein
MEPCPPHCRYLRHGKSRAHKRHHTDVLPGVEFKRAKNENVIRENGCYRVSLVSTRSSARQHNAVVGR